MLIRSQDKMSLRNYDGIFIDRTNKNNIYGDINNQESWYLVGKYSSETETMNVLNNIHRFMDSCGDNCSKCYEMPKAESETEKGNGKDKTAYYKNCDWCMYRNNINVCNYCTDGNKWDHWCANCAHYMGDNGYARRTAINTVNCVDRNKWEPSDEYRAEREKGDK